MAGPIDERELGTRVAGILNRRPVAGLALAVVGNGALQWFSGSGFADAESRTPVTEDTVFRVASISKTFTAIAVMQLWERGLVDLDAPAGDYLRAYRLVPAEAGWRPVTLRHLLTHTSGIGELRGLADLFLPTWGAEVERGPAPPLADWYREGLRVRAEPGTHFAYTDHNFSTLGQIVEDVSGEPFDRYLAEHVFGPLGMDGTDTVGERVRPRLATGYVLRPGGLRAVVSREFALGGAGFVYSTAKDMARYAAALLGGGANEHGSVLRPGTLATMFEPHYRPDPRLPGIGLAFFRAEAGGRSLIEHQGILPGFTSQLFLAPGDGVGVVALTNMGSPAPLWLPWESSDLLRELIGIAPDAVRSDVPQHPEVWEEICGRYAATGPATNLRARAVAGAEVLVRRGRLTLRLLTPVPSLLRGLPLHPDDDADPYVFRIDLARFGLGTARIAFDPGARAGTMALRADVAPITLEKRPGRRNRTAVAAGALAAGVAAVAVRQRRAGGRRSAQA